METPNEEQAQTPQEEEDIFSENHPRFSDVVRAIELIRPVVHNRLMQMRIAADQKRRSIIRELIETERNYCDSLLVLDEVYYRPLDQSLNSSKKLIDSTSLSIIFGNVDEISNAHRTGILSVMDEILPQLNNPFPPTEIYIRLADAFHEMTPRLQQLYTAYIKTNEQADVLLTKLQKNSRALREFLGACVFNPRAKCRCLEDFIILPLQRISGYKLLFERVLKYFKDPNSPENVAFSATLQAMVSLGSTMNHEKSGARDQEKLLTVSEAVTGLPPFLFILKPGRKLIGKSTLWQMNPETDEKTTKCMAYVMTDILLLTEIKKGNFLTGTRHIYIAAIPVTQAKICPSPSARYGDRSILMKTDTAEYHFTFAKEDKMTGFINAVKHQRKNIRRRVKKQSQEGATHMQTILNKLSELYTTPQPPKTKTEALASL